MKRTRAGLGFLGSVALLGAAALATGGVARAPEPPAPPASGCPVDAGIALPPGFCATVFADGLGHVRHMAVRGDGTVFANTWSGRYFANSPPPPTGFFMALKDADGDGKAEAVARFGPAPGGSEGAAGGSGVALYGGYVYFELNDRIVRYRLPAGAFTPAGDPETVLSGMPLGGDHPMHPFIVTPRGELFVDMGSATNSCQPQNRRAEVAGTDPCTELQTRGGIWRYDARKTGQVFSPAERYATGLRNAEGLAFDAAGRFFATSHGRDQLQQNWGRLYPDAARTLELPSEELVQVTAASDHGWPRCYHDKFQNKRVLAPEYGGDGGRAVGGCGSAPPAVAAFPSHWGPNDLAIYGGRAFPAAYRGGAFIAFHGSWNRAPAPQDGYNVVFQPLRDGRASGPWAVFADGFAPVKDPGKAAYRPTGLAVMPDGALLISDDVKGRIWRVTYRGPANAAVAGALHVSTAGAAAPAAPAAAATAGARGAPPPGSSQAELAAGERVYRTTTCSGCHGAEGGGTPLGPSLTSGPWLWGGSLPAVTASIEKGVAEPKQYRSPMPPMGGASLTPADLKAVSAYVWSIGRGKAG